MLERVGVLRPLRERDFALLWLGMAVSLLGDGVFLVAVPWQVYELSRSPTSASLVGAAWTVPMVVLLTVGGVLSDRLGRRRLMITADLLRLVATGALAGLALAGALAFWKLLALVVLYGVGESLFAPSFTAIVPELVPRELLVEANSLDQFVRPAALQFVGPALGGGIVAAFGTGGAFALDAGSFVVSLAAVAAMRVRPPAARPARGGLAAELREGFAFVRAHTWLWGTLLAVSVSLLAQFGPQEVLLPYVVKFALGGGPAALGLVLASAGAGSIVAAVALGQRGIPRRHVTFMYVSWALVPAGLVVVAFAGAVWQLMAAWVLVGACTTGGMVVWGTLMHRHVPAEVLGRVSSIDWTVSIALLPLSFALTGPVAGVLGVRTTLLCAGVLGSLAVAGFLALPGMRESERAGAEAESA